MLITDEKKRWGSVLIKLQFILTGGSTHKYITIIVHYRKKRRK